jgi:hypothetical protein
VRVRGDPVRRLIRSRSRISHDGSYLALIVRAVGPHCRFDESGLGAREAAAVGRVDAIRIVHHRVHYSVHRHAGIECATDFMGGVDEAWHALEGGDTFLIEQCQKLVVLVWVGRCRATVQNCDAG